MTNSITGIVITLNEEANIEECLLNLKQVCNELIVVDSNSTDKTREIAEKVGAKVYIQSYLGDGFQKNVGLQYSSNKWVLSLDADERLTKEMVDEINKLDLNTTTFDAFGFRRRNMIGSWWIKRCGWYPDFCTRLYNKEKTKFKEVKQHSYVETKNVLNIKADMIHYSFKSLSELFAKNGRPFASRGAKILYQKGKKANSFTPFIHGLTSFIRHYFIKLGFLGGLDGLTVSVAAGVNAYIKYALLLEMQRDPKVLERTNFKSVW